MALRIGKRPQPTPNDKIFNIYHPEFEGKIEPTINKLTGQKFVANGIQYYNFKKDTEIRAGRYMVIQNFLQEVFYRMDTERLKMYISQIISELNGTKGTVNIGNALELLGHMKKLTEMAFEPETIYRLASAVFFDETEDLRSWDLKHNEIKIQGWKEDGTLDFFYVMAFEELTGLKGISETDLRGYLEVLARQSEEYKRVLLSVTQTPSDKSSTTQE